MSADAEVVVLSSTPDHNFSRASQQASYSASQLFGLSPRPSSPSPVASPSELLRIIQSPSKDLPQTEKTTNKRVSGTKSTLDGDAPENKPKRGRKKKATDEKQTILKDPEPTSLEQKDNAPKKTTKPRAKRAGTESKSGGTKNKTLTGRVSKSSAVESSLQKDTAKGQQDAWETDGLQLEEATKRRRDWTPPPNDSTGLSGNGSANGRGSPETTPTRDFTGLLSGYEFTGLTDAQPNMQPVEAGDGPTKRRRIELVESNITSNPKRGSSDENSIASSEKTNQQPAPAKKPKKKTKRTTTLTARVTARYASDYTEDDTGSQHGATTKSAPEKKRKSKTKQKPQEPEFIVLSPEAAVKSLDDQDLMFGTCSQLEREDSPTTLREMQTAIKASESYMKPEGLIRGASSRSLISRSAAPKNLWSEAFRDLDGDLAQVEVVDLADSCDISQISPRKDSDPSGQNEKKTEESSVTRQKPQTKARKGASKPTESQAEHIPRQVDDTRSKQPESASSAAGKHPEMPHYGGLTDAELAKQISAYGFKSIRGRQKMIDLLQKCWASKYGSSTEPDSTKQGSSQLNTAKSKKTDSSDLPGDAPTSTPKRNSRTKHQQTTKVARNPPSKSPQKTAGPSRVSQKPSFADVEEIEDSEDEAILSPIRLQPQPVRGNHTPQRPSSQSLPVPPRAPSTPSRAASTKPRNGPSTATVILDSCDEEDDEDYNLPDLSVQITKAIQAQRSTPVSASASASAGGPLGRVSWHEKILMYDPIVIEDFATWLNTEGLGLIAEDREVGAGFLRTWCESKGICCCYRKDRV